MSAVAVVAVVAVAVAVTAVAAVLVAVLAAPATMRQLLRFKRKGKTNWLNGVRNRIN